MSLNSSASFNTSETMSKQYWRTDLGPTDNSLPHYNQFQSLWPSPDIGEPQVQRPQPNIGPTWLPQSFPVSTQLPHQQPMWQYSNNGVIASAPAWPPAQQQQYWPNSMISRGTMIFNQTSSQNATPAVVNRTNSAPQARTQTPTQSRPAGIVKNKRKRKRTAFTTDQILALEKIFSTQPYIDRAERQSISDKLNINERAIKIWFQNRRMKSKRATFEDSDDQEDDNQGDAFMAQNSPPSDVDSINTQIPEADQFGFVTLDENVLESIVNVLDDILPENIDLSPTNVDLSNKIIESCDDSEVSVTPPINTVVYDPISPAESDPIDDDSWEPPQDKESIIKLFDLHFC